MNVVTMSNGEDSAMVVAERIECVLTDNSKKTIDITFHNEKMQDLCVQMDFKTVEEMNSAFNQIVSQMRSSNSDLDRIMIDAYKEVYREKYGRK